MNVIRSRRREVFSEELIKLHSLVKMTNELQWKMLFTQKRMDIIHYVKIIKNSDTKNEQENFSRRGGFTR